MHNYSISLGMEHLKNPPLRCWSTHSITLLDRNMKSGTGYQGYLPSCELHIHSRRSLSGGLAKWKFVDCTCKLCDLEIAHVCYEIGCTITRLERNLRIPRMRNAISRLRKFSDCTEHIKYMLNVQQQGMLSNEIVSPSSDHAMVWSDCKAWV